MNEHPKRNRLKPKRKFRLHKALFVLPNLFTLSGIFCGFYAIYLSTNGSTRLYEASLAVFFGIFFDMADGRVARLTRTQSDFGVQLDSLADAITFGVAPAFIVRAWAFSKLGMLGLFLAFVFTACGVLRLARFNVLAMLKHDEGPSDFVGLPIPLAAGVVASLVMFHQRFVAGPVEATGQVIFGVLILAYLMISTIRYRSFKKITFNRKTLIVVSALFLTFATLSLTVHPAFALLVFSGVYILVGLIEAVLRANVKK